MTPSTGNSITTAWILFLALAALLAVFVLGIALLTWRRNRRGGRPDRGEKPTGPDPWSEAGRRAEPYDESSD